MVLVLVLGLVSTSSAQIFRDVSKVGTTSAQFLKIGAGARAIAMGGAYTALSNDIYSIYYNPAGIATTKTNTEVSFNHANWIADISYDFGAVAIKLGDMGTLFADFTVLSVPEDDVTTYENPDGDGRKWDAGDIAIGIGFARQLTDRFSIGFHGKFIQQSIWNSSASGFAFDVGTLYRTPFNDLMIGASISNFGSKMQLDGRDIAFNYDPDDDLSTGPNNIPSQYTMGKFDLPLTFRVGLSMDVVDTRYYKLTAAMDAVHPNDNSEYVNTGVEASYDQMIFIRAGYKQLWMNNNEGGLTLGAGFKFKVADMRLMVNYGYADYGILKSVQFFDLGLSF